MRSVMLWVLLAGCWHSPEAPTPRPPAPPDAPWVGYTLSERGLGPLGERSQVMLRTLHTMFPQHRIERRELPETDGLIYEAFAGSERVFYVVPADEYGPFEHPVQRRQFSTRVSEIFVVSPRIAIEHRAWRVGEVLESVADLQTCRCWGDAEVAACFAPDRHVAVVLERDCSDAERQGPAVLVGQRIARLLWRASTELAPESDSLFGGP